MIFVFLPIAIISREALTLKYWDIAISPPRVLGVQPWKK